MADNKPIYIIASAMGDNHATMNMYTTLCVYRYVLGQFPKPLGNHCNACSSRHMQKAAFKPQR